MRFRVFFGVAAVIILLLCLIEIRQGVVTNLIKKHSHIKKVMEVISQQNKTSSISMIINAAVQNKFDRLRQNNNATEKTTEQNMKTKLGVKVVLFYTTWFGDTKWPYQGIDNTAMKLIHFDNKRQCAHRCRITYNKSEMAHSDAVMFHSRDMPGNFQQLKIVSDGRNQRQRWIYSTQENAHNNGRDPAQYNGIFNWTITYRTDSDLVIPYGSFREISTNEIPKDHNITNYAKGKDKLVAWAVSHCVTIRDNVVKKLSEFIPISVYGGCSRLIPKRINVNDNNCPRHSEQCAKIMKTFKFYLSLENGICTDYITEKYWDTPIFYNMVPIVLGPEYFAKLAIPGSYINLFDFPSIEALANYIKYLDKNDTAYNEYFKWKAKYQRWDPSWTCQLCENLYNDTLPRKVYDNLGDFWGTKACCSKHEAKLTSYISG